MNIFQRAQSGRRSMTRRGADRLWRAGDALVITSLLAGGWWWYANRAPQIAIPADAPPTRVEAGSAYARLVAAGQQVTRGEEIGFAIGNEQSQIERFGHAFTPADKDAMLAKNAAPLAALRATLDSGDPVRPFVPTDIAGDTGMTDYAKLRGMARLLRLESQRHADKGEWGAAASSQLDSLRLGLSLQEQSALLPSLVGIACEAIGRRPLWGMVEHLSAEEARDSARKLEKANDNRSPASVTFTQEKWATERSLADAFRTNSLPQFAIRLAEDGRDKNDPLPVGEKWAIGTLSLLQPKASVIAGYGRFMDDCAAAAAQPHHPGMLTDLSEPHGPILKILTPVLGQALQKSRDSQAQTALMIATLALRAYQAEHDGASPASLADLVAGGYLSHVPTDPFTPEANAPLQYIRSENGHPILYSVGPDGQDDSGTPLDNRTKDGKYKPWSEQDSKGDIVVGVNLHSEVF